ncbi:hypothetical protein [Oscillatoria sp. FACHB-1407]|nr:hypothetical protein [Oscillatoria sp. FACHB-1407]
MKADRRTDNTIAGIANLEAIASHGELDVQYLSKQLELKDHQTE